MVFKWGVNFILLSFTKNKADFKCSQKDKITACSRATGLQLHLPGIVPVTVIPGSTLVMQLLKEALSPSTPRPLLRDL